MATVDESIWSATLDHVRRMERQELRFYRAIRPLYEDLFPTFHQQMQAEFASVFSPLLSKEEPAADPLLATTSQLVTQWTTDLDAVLTAVEDEWEEVMDEEVVEAHDNGWWFVLWLLFLQARKILDDVPPDDIPPPDDALAYVLAGSYGGVSYRERATFWRVQALEKFRQQMLALTVSGATWREIDERAKTVLTQYQTALAGLGADEIHLAHGHGQERALQTLAEGGHARWLWVTRADERVCKVCAPLHQTYTDKRPIFDTHPACLVAATVVGHATARVATKRLYEGVFVTIQVASEEQLTVTENHPVLTRRGWIAAGLVQEGDEVICCSGQHRVVARIDNHDVDMEATISQVEEALRGSRGMTTIEVEQATKDFHGDGTYGEVAHVTTESRLVLGDDAALCQERQQLALDFRRRRLALRHRGRRPLALQFGLRAASRGGVRGGNLPGTLVCRHGLPLDPLLLARRPQRNATPLEEAADGVATYARILGELEDRFPGEVAADVVVGIGREYGRRHVYNLETDAGYYTGNSIIVSNCRCLTIPVVEGEPPPAVTFTTFKRRHA